MFGKKIRHINIGIKISKFVGIFVTVLFLSRFFSLLVFAEASTAPAEPLIVNQKDTDLDGISDSAEINIYKTNPNKPDTDGDGVLDYQEIIDKTDPLNANSSALLDAQKNANVLLSRDMPVFWYVGRVAGIAAFIMFTLVICMGLLMTSKFLLKFRFLSAPNALEMHSFNATFVAFALVLIHITSFMFDEFIKLSLPEVLVPFLAKRDFLTTSIGVTLTIPLSLGIIALYVAIILIFTSHFRRKIIPVKIWRAIHYSSFLFYLLFLVHGFASGTDTKEPWMFAIYLISLVLVVSLIFLRIFGKNYFISSITRKPTPIVNPSQAASSAQAPLDNTAVKS